MNQKLDVGNVFERVFAIYRDQFTLLVPAALVVFVPVALLNGVLRESGGFLLAIAAIIVGAIATYWFQGMVVEAAHDILDGRRDHTVGSLLSAVTPVIGPLLVAGFLGGLAIGIGFVLLIVPGLFLLTIWSLIAPVIVIERTDAMSSFGRSRALVKGHGWQVLAVLVVLLLLKLVLSAVVAAILIAIADSRGELRGRGPDHQRPHRSALRACRGRHLLPAETAPRRDRPSRNSGVHPAGHGRRTGARPRGAGDPGARTALARSEVGARTRRRPQR